MQQLGEQPSPHQLTFHNLAQTHDSKLLVHNEQPHLLWSGWSATTTVADVQHPTLDVPSQNGVATARVLGSPQAPTLSKI